MVGTYENVDNTLHISFVVHRPFIVMIEGFFVPLYAESYGDNYVKVFECKPLWGISVAEQGYPAMTAQCEHVGT